jgi:hypothetical protein
MRTYVCMPRAACCAQMGLQEKASFVQAFNHVEPSADAMLLPRVIALSVVSAAAATLYAMMYGRPIPSGYPSGPGVSETGELLTSTLL